MNWGKIYGEKRRGEKCLAGKFVCGEKFRGENCLGKNVVGKIVSYGKMLQSHPTTYIHVRKKNYTILERFRSKILRRNLDKSTFR